MYKVVITSSVISLLAGLFIGKYLLTTTVVKEKKQLDKRFSEVRETGYKFISPLLECDTAQNEYALSGLNPLQKELRGFIDAKENQGSLSDAAVYFRDLNNGPWLGVNENAVYSPASLLKLPVMMAYFKKVESDPELLKKKVKYLGKEVLLGQSIKPDRQIEKGKEYTVEDLIFRMMIYSDNAALTLLEENIEPILIDKVTLDLGVETATEKSPDDFMSVKGYAGLFRILYNASYIEKSYSEKALDILSHTEFDKGLVAGIPKGVTIAHKFGEREIGNNIKQLHDCGIVYHTRPYLLCVMTRGKDLNVLANIISQISKLTYDSVQKNIISAP